MTGPVNDEFTTINDMQKPMDKLAREVAAMPRDDPRRHQTISELTRLSPPCRFDTKEATLRQAQPSLTFLTLDRII
jgi:hypothetical protein